LIVIIELRLTWTRDGVITGGRFGAGISNNAGYRCLQNRGRIWAGNTKIVKDDIATAAYFIKVIDKAGVG